MRRPRLALLGLMFATLLATGPAFAAQRSGEGGRAAAPARHAVAAPGAKKAVAPGRVQFLAHRGAGQARHLPVKARFGWAQGLSPAAGIQANECPDGTLATLARGHEDVVRCMPI